MLQDEPTQGRFQVCLQVPGGRVVVLTLYSHPLHLFSVLRMAIGFDRGHLSSQKQTLKGKPFHPDSWWTGEKGLILPSLQVRRKLTVFCSFSFFSPLLSFTTVCISMGPGTGVMNGSAGQGVQRCSLVAADGHAAMS